MNKIYRIKEKKITALSLKHVIAVIGEPNADGSVRTTVLLESPQGTISFSLSQAQYEALVSEWKTVIETQ